MNTKVHSALKIRIPMLLASALIASCGGSNSSDASSASPVTVISPTAGAFVSPGGTLSVTVGIKDASKLANVQVITSHFGTSLPVTAPPYTMSVAIPAHSECNQSFGIVSLMKDQSVTVSDPIPIHVEPDPSTVQSIAIDPPILLVDSDSPTYQIGVRTQFTDGSIGSLDGCSKLSLASQDNSIATVDSTGLVTGRKTGVTQIQVSYGSATNSVMVKVSMPGT